MFRHQSFVIFQKDCVLKTVLSQEEKKEDKKEDDDKVCATKLDSDTPSRLMLAYIAQVNSKFTIKKQPFTNFILKIVL